MCLPPPGPPCHHASIEFVGPGGFRRKTAYRQRVPFDVRVSYNKTSAPNGFTLRFVMARCFRSNEKGSGGSHTRPFFPEPFSFSWATGPPLGDWPSSFPPFPSLESSPPPKPPLLVYTPPLMCLLTATLGTTLLPCWSHCTRATGSTTRTDGDAQPHA